MPSMPFSVCSTTPDSGVRWSATVVGWPMPRLTYEPAGMSRGDRPRRARSWSSGPRSVCSTVGQRRWRSCWLLAVRGDEIDDPVDEDARRDDVLGVDVADLDDPATPRRSVIAAAVAITGPKLRAVLRYTRLPIRSPTCAPISATSPWIGYSSTYVAAVDLRGSPCPRPAACRRRSGRRTRRCPAPAARIRSARLPCGTTSSSTLPAR